MVGKRRKKARAKSGFFKNKIAIVIIFFLVFVAIMIVYSFVGNNNSNTNDILTNDVLLRTDRGDIIVRLYDDMPITAGNFKKLVEQGVYDGTIFHRVIAGFMVQGGDPTGTGYGDPSIPAIPDEFTDHNRNDRGTISMANAGPNTGSSQFFINLMDNSYLDAKHPVFGKIIEGMDVVDKIAEVETDANDRPLQEVRITKAELVK